VLKGKGFGVVGASGFEPPTSWSRTSGQINLSRCAGVTCSFSGRSQLDKFGQAPRNFGQFASRVQNSRTGLPRIKRGWRTSSQPSSPPLQLPGRTDQLKGTSVKQAQSPEAAGLSGGNRRLGQHCS
jgi:hypothetical protein